MSFVCHLFVTYMKLHVSAYILAERIVIYKPPELLCKKRAQIFSVVVLAESFEVLVVFFSLFDIESYAVIITFTWNWWGVGFLCRSRFFILYRFYIVRHEVANYLVYVRAGRHVDSKFFVVVVVHHIVCINIRAHRWYIKSTSKWDSKQCQRNM